MDDHVGVVGGLQGEAPMAGAAAITLLLVHLHDVLQVLLPAAEGELWTRTLLSCARSPDPRGQRCAAATQAPWTPERARFPLGEGGLPRAGPAVGKITKRGGHRKQTPVLLDLPAGPAPAPPSQLPERPSSPPT